MIFFFCLKRSVFHEVFTWKSSEQASKIPFSATLSLSGSLMKSGSMAFSISNYF